LFVAAAQSYRYDSQLRPFPPFYQDASVPSVDIAGILAVIAKVPPLSSILGLLYGMLGDKQDEVFRKHESVLRLLHWILVTVSEPCLKSVDRANFGNILNLTKSTHPGPRPTHIFEVVASNDSPTERKFKGYASNSPTAYAFHGSKLYSFHSILNYGLQQHLCKTALFGEGIYLSSEMHVSLHFSPAGLGWKLSQFGRELSCLAICEFVEDPEHVKRHTKDVKTASRQTANNVPEKYIIITNNDIVRLIYLVIFGREERISKHLAVTRSRSRVINWMTNNKSVLVMSFYVIVLLAIGFANNNGFTYFRQVFWRKAQNFFHNLITPYFN